jgi:hypothetical protein
MGGHQVTRDGTNGDDVMGRSKGGSWGLGLRETWMVAGYV